ncbi:MAG: alanine--tRNA ligase, partial [Clostridia bacterium]|nr:alanine--tRNA ligase [Clostridia bacterium]
DNFWEHGSGPCGPCSEIYFDRGEKYGCGSPDCKPGCDCDRFMEIWNNVFSQFNNDGNGNYTELAQKNIDTGMGLERLACVMQGVDNLFEVDTVRKILNTVCAIADKQYGADAKDDVSIRVITDHIRSATFMICDGVIPSNEGRGYVLRRILRRACRHGKLLGISRAFLAELCEVVIGENITAYPELGEKKEYILKVISIEEERFDATIDAGLGILNTIIDSAKADGKTVVAGEDVFKLYDTFGFPLDLTREIILENGLDIDEDAFNTLMKAQKERARAARGNIGGWDSTSKEIFAGIGATEFVGYAQTSAEAKVVAIIVDGMLVNEVSEGEFTLILDKTPFYGEGGGQVGDAGKVENDNAGAAVLDTKKMDGIYLHICIKPWGIIKVGDTLNAKVGACRRQAIMRNHSSLHLLQAALRQVLGNHVEQAGSYVDDVNGRFDFTHFSALTAEELAKVEAIVNKNILSGVAVDTVETDIESAKKMGAMALFGEKYGKIVRVVKMGDCSTEFCGGTHVDNTAKIGLFKIVSESSVAAGVRRIEAKTGLGVLGIIADNQNLIAEAAAELKAQNPADIAKRAAILREELHAAKGEIDSLNAKLAASKIDGLVGAAEQIGGVRLVCARFDDMQIDAVRALCDELKSKYSDIVSVIAINVGGKLNFIASAGKDAVACGVHAGKLVGAVASVTGGKGGGRPDNAMAGGADASKIDEALASAKATVASMLK